jgi:microcystin-dependent protein
MRLLRNFGVIAASKAGGAIDPGLIVMWYGTVETVPEGWSLCNGQNGTPNLTDRFIVGSGDTYSIGNTGGSANAIVPSHNHTGSTNTTGSHTHGFRTYAGGGSSGSLTGSGTGTITTSSAGGHSHSTVTSSSAGDSGTNANLPPYLSLFYIMKGVN